MKRMIATLVVLFSSIVVCIPQGNLLDSFEKLRSAVQNSYDFAKQQCVNGSKRECQDLLVQAALLGTIDAEVALNRLKVSVPDGEASDKIHRALSNLDDAESDINRAREALGH